MARALGVIGQWWSLLIIREAFTGVTRFDDFQRRLGISRNALADRLRSLVDAGVLTRRSIAPGQSREEYVLTPMGDGLLPIIVALRQWGDRWLFADEDLPADMVDTEQGDVLPALEIRAADGRSLGRGGIKLRPREARRDAVADTP